MTRARKIWLWSLSSLLSLLVALLLFVALFDWNLLKPTLNQQVSAALNRPFAIQGNLAVYWQREAGEGGWRSWLPSPHISAQQLVLGNPEWAKGDTFVSLDEVTLRLSLLPLLWKTVSIPRVDVKAPMADLQRLADGRANWTFDLGNDETGQEQQPSPWTLDIGTIGFDKGVVRYDDPLTGASLQVNVEPLGKPIPFSEIVGQAQADRAANEQTMPQDYAFAWQAQGRYQNLPVTGSGKVGGLLALKDASLPFPLQADISAGRTRVQVAGTLTDPQHLGALDLRLRIAGSSLGNLYPLTGVTLPDTPAYATDGHLRGNLKDAAGARFSYEGFNGTIGESDIHGDLTLVASQPRAKLSGQLVSNQLLFKDLAPLIGADSNAAKKERGAASTQPADKVLPVEAFRTERWRAMDADVRFTGKRIVHSDQLPISDLDTHLLLEDGQLSLEPLRFGVAGGHLESSIHLNGAVTPLQGKARLGARKLKLKQLFPSFAPMRTSLGELNGDAELQGNGNSVAALLAGANGQLQMLINDGAVSRDLMEIAGLNVGNYVVGKLFGDEDVQINCAAADLGIKNGLLSTRLFVIDTENAVIKVDGTANFANERLNLDIVPTSKGWRVISLRSPLYVNGTFKTPKPGVRATPLVLRGVGLVALGVAVAPAAGLLALVAPSGSDENQCGAFLRQVRNAKN